MLVSKHPVTGTAQELTSDSTSAVNDEGVAAIQKACTTTSGGRVKSTREKTNARSNRFEVCVSTVSGSLRSRICLCWGDVVGEAIGVAGQRTGDLPDGGRDRHRQGRGEGFAERLQVPDERSCRCPDSPAS